MTRHQAISENDYMYRVMHSGIKRRVTSNAALTYVADNSVVFNFKRLTRELWIQPKIQSFDVDSI